MKRKKPTFNSQEKRRYQAIAHMQLKVPPTRPSASLPPQSWPLPRLTTHTYGTNDT